MQNLLVGPFLFCLFWFFLGFKFWPIYATFSLLLIGLWIVLCNLVGLISISKNHAWWFCCDLWCEAWHGFFWLGGACVQCHCTRCDADICLLLNTCLYPNVSSNNWPLDTSHSLFGLSLSGLNEIIYFKIKKKKKIFQGSFFKRGLHTFSRFWQKTNKTFM